MVYNAYHMNSIVLRVAAKAVIVNEKNQVLLVRESSTHDTNTQSGLFGIPGGRLEIGEMYEDGLIREVREETGLEVVIGQPFYIGEWHPIIKGVKHQIIAIFTVCKAKVTEVKLSEEHDDYRWVGANDLKDINFMDPDDKVLERYFSHN